ncbi:MAG: YciI family protein [Sporolactobacillus sp.]
MFVANLTYRKPLAEVEKYLEKHLEFLENHYQTGHFICSGRKNPRTGGVILIRARNEAELKQIIAEDPFYANQIADYELIEFYPTKYAADFEPFTQALK